MKETDTGHAGYYTIAGQTAARRIWLQTILDKCGGSRDVWTWLPLAWMEAGLGAPTEFEGEIEPFYRSAVRGQIVNASRPQIAAYTAYAETLAVMGAGDPQMAGMNAEARRLKAIAVKVGEG